MEHFYRRLLGALLARTEATQPSPRLPSIIRAMTWDFVARTTGPGDITLWFGCDSPIAAAAPLLCSGSIPSREDTNVSIVFGGYREFKRDGPGLADTLRSGGRLHESTRDVGTPKAYRRAALLCRLLGSSARRSHGEIVQPPRRGIRPSCPPSPRHLLVRRPGGPRGASRFRDGEARRSSSGLSRPSETAKRGAFSPYASRRREHCALRTASTRRSSTTSRLDIASTPRPQVAGAWHASKRYACDPRRFSRCQKAADRCFTNGSDCLSSSTRTSSAMSWRMSVSWVRTTSCSTTGHSSIRR